MSDVVRLLPDSVANQIAAGEVIQRPASVVKELVENAIDAGADDIKIIIKDAGRTLIQVTDNGRGMSPTDARMCFERHATSKIANADDLFRIRTMGFRGEALASIAAVAHVELKTRREQDQLGTLVIISGSEFKSQEPYACPKGSTFLVKNLFYNVPARRKFLKSDNIEYKHIVNEVYRVVLTYPDINFELINNGITELSLRTETLKQRIAGVFGKNILQNLIQISTETSIVKISGYIAKPERTRKTTNEQFFFVNKRFMIHPYFRKAVQMAYEKLIPEGEYPTFFIYFETDPSRIDINIHPTKTEIKFEEEQSIFHILNATVKEALGKFSVVPPIDFTEDITRDVHLTSKTQIRPPSITINPDYNPFGNEVSKSTFNKISNTPRNWQILFDKKTSDGKSPDDFYLQGFDNIPVTQHSEFFTNNNENADFRQPKFLQIKSKYVITQGKSGIIIIDVYRANERIFYEKFLSLLETRKGVCQKSLFPIIFEPTPQERAILLEIITELNNIGFEIVIRGKDKFEILGMPAELTDSNPAELLRLMIYQMSELSIDAKTIINEKLAASLAKAAIKNREYILSEDEMELLFYNLMRCSNHNFTPDGKKIIEMITADEIDKKFNN